MYTHADIIIPINIFRIQGNNSTVCVTLTDYTSFLSPFEKNDNKILSY